MRFLSLLAPFLMFGTPIIEKPGPYELEGSVCAVLQFIFTLMIVIGKFRIVRITSSILAAIAGGGAFVLYYINQTSVGNPLSFGPMAIFAAGFVYGTIISIILIINTVKQRKIKKMAREREAEMPKTRRRFDD